MPSFSSLARHRCSTPLSSSRSFLDASSSLDSPSLASRRALPSSAVCRPSSCERASSSTCDRSFSASRRSAWHSRLRSMSSASSHPAWESPLSWTDSTTACSRWIVPWSASRISRSCWASPVTSSSCPSASCSRACSIPTARSRCCRLSTSDWSWFFSTACCLRLSASALRLWCACCHCAFMRISSCIRASISAFCCGFRNVPRRVSNWAMSELHLSVRALAC
mmetsp:Transcript_55080/g.143345  ORF Transcript_55080/g.143345 Transcript_55080/m.143345 type:complete len:223 (-) Transcript_55080:308-976(-)